MVTIRSFVRSCTHVCPSNEPSYKPSKNDKLTYKKIKQPSHYHRVKSLKKKSIMYNMIGNQRRLHKYLREWRSTSQGIKGYSHHGASDLTRWTKCKLSKQTRKGGGMGEYLIVTFSCLFSPFAFFSLFLRSILSGSYRLPLKFLSPSQFPNSL